MDAAIWAAIVGPVTTLLGGLGGYWLAGRNDDARDIRAAQREIQARRDGLAERLEEDRHAFQRDTLLELQDELQRMARNTSRILLQDEKTIKQLGQLYQLGGDLSDEAMQIMVSVQRLRARVLDDQLRGAVGDFSDLCASLNVGFGHPQGMIEDDQKERAIARIRAQQQQHGTAYAELTELLGTHLRRELDRRFLLVARNDQAARP